MGLRDLERSTASASPARGSSHSTLVCDHVERLKRGDAFGSVDGERIWLAMHGHDVRWTKRTTPASLSHSRVLDPSSRSKAEPVARWLALCGWLRARRAGLRPGKVQLEATVGDRRYAVLSQIQHPGGEGEVMAATSTAWRALTERYLPERISVVLDELSPDPWQHLDLLDGTYTMDDPLACAIAEIRDRFGGRSIRRGETGDPTGPYTGLKISFERVPSLEEVDLFLGPKWVVSGSVPAQGAR